MEILVNFVIETLEHQKVCKTLKVIQEFEKLCKIHEQRNHPNEILYFQNLYEKVRNRNLVKEKEKNFMITLIWNPTFSCVFDSIDKSNLL